MRAFEIGFLAVITLPGLALGQAEPIVELVCSTVGCSGSCDSDLSQCRTDLSTCDSGYSACESDLSACETERASCASDLSKANADLEACNGERASCASERNTCNEGLESCTEALSASSFFPATGQTTSYRVRDDGDLERGAALSYTDNGDGTITDHNTGLMWEKKVKGDGVSNYDDLHDADNSYTWNSVNDIFNWVGVLNATSFAGYSDWRIPNVKELQSIVDYERVRPSVAPAFHSASCGGGCADLASPACSCTASDNYWSSSTFRDATDDAWIVYFADGLVGPSYKSFNSSVRAVRGGSR